MTRNQLAKIGLAARKFSDKLERAADKWGDVHGYEDGVHSELNDTAEKLMDLFFSISSRAGD